MPARVARPKVPALAAKPRTAAPRVAALRPPARAAALCIRRGRRVRPVRFSRPSQGSLRPRSRTSAAHARRPRRRRRSPPPARAGVAAARPARSQPAGARSARWPPAGAGRSQLRRAPARRRPAAPCHPAGRGQSAGPERALAAATRPACTDDETGFLPLHLPQDPDASGRKSHPGGDPGRAPAPVR